MYIENTIANQPVINAAQTIALENMHVSRDVLESSLDVCSGKRKWDDWFKEVLAKYERQ